MNAKKEVRALHVAEPPAASLGRPPMVVDCSVLSAILFQEDSFDDAVRTIAGKTLHAPFLLDSELVSVGVKKAKAGLQEALVVEALAMYTQQGIELHHPEIEAQFALALRHGLSAYDAAYLWLAGTLQAPLATFDAKLAKAARAHLAGPA